MLLQSGSGSIAVLFTIVFFAFGLSVTAHLAARNVLGDVDPKRALLVGPLPAVVGVVGGAFSLPAALSVPVAILLDAAAIHRAYGQPPRGTALITFIHFVITVLVTVVVVGVAILIASRPT
ncbi:hypothetical protein ACFQAS_10995 [Halopenitus salinus]|jgi:hypothetical protein|uniref:Uncharacterized protein n=1 Tax=Halopenitus salinus TaxID=1198295 RepID=A0ABD5USI0_9EURY